MRDCWQIKMMCTRIQRSRQQGKRAINFASILREVVSTIKLVKIIASDLIFAKLFFVRGPSSHVRGWSLVCEVTPCTARCRALFFFFFHLAFRAFTSFFISWTMVSAMPKLTMPHGRSPLVDADAEAEGCQLLIVASDDGFVSLQKMMDGTG